MLHTLRLRMNHAIAARLARPMEAADLERLRLRVLFAVALLKLFNFIGGAWDIQWHVAIGRDSLWIPPHLMVVAAFVSGLAIVVVMIAYETAWSSAGQVLPHTARLGALRAPGAYFGIMVGYLAALLAGVLDELWHRAFGIDATLWSPPHLLIMAATMVVDYSLLFGIARSARRLGYTFTWKSPLLWGIVLTGAYAYEAVHFQMGEAFIVGHRHGGAGPYGLLFPILIGVFLPLSLIATIRLAKRAWVVLLTAGLALGLQYVATGIAAVGFAVLKPVSIMDQYVLLYPESTAAKAREFAALLGNNGLIGLHQAWTMTLAIPALVLVAVVGALPWARRHPIAAAPVFSVSMVLLAFARFEITPALRDYPITAAHVALAALLALAGGLITGALGLWLTRGAESDKTQRSLPGEGLEA